MLVAVQMVQAACTAPAPPAPPLHRHKHYVLHFLHPTPQGTTRHRQPEQEAVEELELEGKALTK
jgi:hypothetical protein